MIACFVLAVYAKHRAEEGAIQNAGIIKALPPRDDKKLKKMLYKGVVTGAIITGAAIVALQNLLRLSRIRVD